MKPTPNDARDLIEELEADYPPACKLPQESLEDHLRYAGMVDLIQTLRVRLDWTHENSIVSMPAILNKGK